MKRAKGLEPSTYGLGSRAEGHGERRCATTNAVNHGRLREVSPRLLTTREVGDRFRVSPETVRCCELP